MQGADINAVDGKQQSILIYAIERGKIDVVNLLLTKNVTYSICDDRNQSCLHIAAISNSTAIMEKLLKVR